jgi:hypothetical protein
VDHDPSARCQHGAQHVDKANDGATDPGDAAADLIQHAGDRHRTGLDRRRAFHPADFVDQAGIVGRKTRDFRLYAAVAQAATEPLEQPSTESVELGNFRHIDEDIGAASGQLLGVGNDPLEHRCEARGP